MSSKYDICGTGMCRPGGFAITDRALSICNFKQGNKLADIGCGLGATVRYIREHYMLNISGVDNDSGVLSEAAGLSRKGNLSCDDMFIEADGECLPFEDNEMDGLIFECSLSKMRYPEAVLSQCARVIKAGGCLIISDLYSTGDEAEFSGLMGRVETKEKLINMIENNNFSIVIFEDYTDFLRQMWGQIIFEYGIDGLSDMLGTERCKFKTIKSGYCLIVAKKGSD